MCISPEVFEQELINSGKLAEQQKNQRAIVNWNKILKQTHDKN